MKKHNYNLPGKPIPLQRPRFSAGKVFDAQKQQKLIAGIQLKKQHNNQPPLIGPLRLHVTFFMPITKEMAKSKNIFYYHQVRPDLDNCIKWICDVANTILYHDDAQICSITAHKVYDKDPRTEFTLRELHGEDGKKNS